MLFYCREKAVLLASEKQCRTAKTFVECVGLDQQDTITGAMLAKVARAFSNVQFKKT